MKPCIKVYFQTEAQKKKVEKRAKKLGISASSYIKSLILKDGK